MLETGVRAGSDDDGAISFYEAGSDAAGEFHCAECSYGVIVHAVLPTCPMCGGRVWETGAAASPERTPLL
jgi:hypothetical protein